MSESFQHISAKLDRYINKYYNISIIRGTIVFVALNVLLIILFSMFSYGVDANVTVRSLLVVLLALSVLGSFWVWIALPFLQKIGVLKRMQYIQAAKRIEVKNPVLGEKLINAIQLQSVGFSNNELISAGIDQIIVSIKVFDLSGFIGFKAVQKASYYLIVPLTIFMGLFIAGELNSFVEGSSRLIDFSTEYASRDLVEFYFESPKRIREGDDYKVSFRLESEYSPETVLLYSDGFEVPVKLIDGRYTGLIRNVKKDFILYASAGRYSSDKYKVEVDLIPRINEYILQANPPEYTNLDSETYTNQNVITVAENSEVLWNFLVKNANSVVIKNNGEYVIEVVDNHALYKGRFSDPQQLKIFSTEKNFNLGTFEIRTIKDKYPSIDADLIYDSLQANRVIVLGNISDDYGFYSLNLIVESSSKEKEVRNINISNNRQRNAFYEEILIEEDSKVWIEVRDNDPYNGYKLSSSKVFELRSIDNVELKKEGLNKSENSRSRLERNKKLLNDQAAEDKPKSRSDKAEKLDEIEELLEDIIKDTEKYKENLEREEQNELYKENILELQEEIEKRVDELDEDVKKLLEEIKKLQEEVFDEVKEEDYENLMDDLETLEEELERTLELLKKLEMEKRLDNLIQDIEKIEEEQKDLSESKEDIKEDQEELSKELENLKKDFSELKELEEELEEKGLENVEDEKLDEASENMEKAEEELGNNKKNKANESQKKAAEELKKMKEQLQSAQSDMNMQGQQENLEDLRQILKNVMVLSDNEEELIKSLREIEVSDPLYSEYMKGQGKLKSDSKIIKDSLNSLMKRAPMIENIVIKELNDIDTYFEKSAISLKDNKKDKGVGEMQYVMTASNNLALLLNQSMESMQNAMSQQKQGDKSCNKPGSGKPGMSELRKMQKQLKKDAEQRSKEKGGSKPDGKKGEGKSSGGSEGLSKMMGRQEMIRMRLSEMRSGENGEENAQLLKEIEELLKKNEEDIANGNFDSEFFERQKEIENKMLESDKATMEREQDDQRESESSMDAYERKRLDELEKYLKNKGVDTEKFKIERIDLSPFYLEKSIEIAK